MYENVNIKPVSMPAIAPSFVIFSENIPINRAGKRDDAARPNAKATTCATKAGG